MMNLSMNLPACCFAFTFRPAAEAIP